jgi:hypothetical protein
MARCRKKAKKRLEAVLDEPGTHRPPLLVPKPASILAGKVRGINGT